MSISKIKDICAESEAMRVWTLVIDAMHIRREICISPGSRCVTGFADIGTGSNSSDTKELPREAIVVLAVGLRNARKLPVAHFLPSFSTPQVKSQLLIREIEELNSVGACVRAVTCDCATDNVRTMKLLGATIPDAPRSFFLDNTCRCYQDFWLTQ